ncbi:MAG: RNA polymerase sigma factor RpoD/SigA [Candidatus Handelsmanbacteria bacterium]|nr:RNA polymerase sigma factor RpoD/SigA [Candidatus Handelsmanbacteria bacterium]
MKKKKRQPLDPKDRPPEGDPLLAAYLEAIAGSRPLSSKDEAALARRIRQGDGEARNLLVEANLRFVIRTAKEYQNRGLSLAELISAGNVGLITAAERFDETRGFKFISYAVWWIRQAILQTLTEQSTVRVPVNRLGLLAKIARTGDALQQQGARPTPERIAQALGLSPREIEDTLVDAQPVRSLDAPFDEAQDQCLLDQLTDEDQPNPEQEVIEYNLRENIEVVLTSLNAREAEVLRLYFGLGQDCPLTLDQIGLRFKLTRERVRQIKELALNKLRHPRYCTRLRSYTDN